MDPKDNKFNSETEVSAAAIAARSEALGKAEKAAAAEKDSTKSADAPAIEAGTEEVLQKSPEVTEIKDSGPIKSPAKTRDDNLSKPDTEVRKWATKLAQENAQVKKEMQLLRESIEKMTKKPLDLNELKKNPEALAKLYRDKDAEVQQMQNKLQETVRREQTANESMRRAQLPEEYPDWNKAAVIIDYLYKTKDPGLTNLTNWEAEDVTGALDKAYEYAKPLIDKVDWSKVPGFTPKAPSVDEDLQKRLDAARREGYESALQDAEKRSKGMTVAGMKGASTNRRPIAPDYHAMPLAELEALVQKNSPKS